MTQHHTDSKSKSNATLYLVATPIGNLKDMTARAVEVLQNVHAVACEDTRVTQKLLNHYGIRTRSFACHSHNEREAANHIIAALQQGQSIALVSDAGTPLLSDPGALLVQQVHAAGFAVVPIPGASAALAALSASGLGGSDFYFAGFLAQQTSEAQAQLRRIEAMPCSVVLYEAPHRLHKTLTLLAASMPERAACVAREITKLHETWYRGSTAELCAQFEGKTVKGECVIVLGSLPEEASDDALVERMLRDALTRLPATKAAAEIAKATGRPRSELYALALSMKHGG